MFTYISPVLCELPCEIHENIIHYLNLRDAIAYSLTSKIFYELIADDSSIWNRFAHNMQISVSKECNSREKVLQRLKINQIALNFYSQISRYSFDIELQNEAVLQFYMMNGNRIQKDLHNIHLYDQQTIMMMIEAGAIVHGIHLWIAIKNNRLDLIDFLISIGVKPNEKHIDLTMNHVAEQMRLNVIMQLIQAGAVPSRKAIKSILVDKDIQTLIRLLDAGIEIPSECIGYFLDSSQPEILKIFLQKRLRLDKNHINMAIEKRDNKMIEMLLNLEISPDSTAISAALSSYWQSIDELQSVLKMLLMKCELKIQDNHLPLPSNSQFKEMTRHHFKKILILLIKLGYQPGEDSFDIVLGFYPSLELIGILLTAGAKPNIEFLKNAKIGDLSNISEAARKLLTFTKSGSIQRSPLNFSRHRHYL